MKYRFNGKKLRKKIKSIKRKTKPKLRKLAGFRDKTISNIDYYFEKSRKDALKLKPRY